MLLREFLGFGGKKKEFKVNDKVTIKSGIYKNYVGIVTTVFPDKGLVEVKWTGDTRKKENIKDLTLFDKDLPLQMDITVKELNKSWGGIGKVYHLDAGGEKVEVFWNDGTFSVVLIKNLEKLHK